MGKISRAGTGGMKSLFGNKKKRETVSEGKRVNVEKTNSNEKINVSQSPFLDALNEAEMSFEKKELSKSLDEINDLGKQLMKSPNLKLLTEYKKRVNVFLKEALKKIYKTENIKGLAKFGGEQKVFVSVKKIDSALEELTIKFIEEHQDALNIIGEVEGIQGLLLNIIA